MARGLVRAQVQACGLDALLEAAELLVTELVTNVVLHVGGELVLGLRCEPGALLLEVDDASTVVPSARTFSATSGTGRGLRLLHALAEEHGVRVREDGKTVWARLTLEGAARSDTELASAFAASDWLADLDDLDDLGDLGGLDGLAPPPPAHGA